MIDLEAEARRMSHWEPSALAMYEHMLAKEIETKQGLLAVARQVLQSKADEGDQTHAGA